MQKQQAHFCIAYIVRGQGGRGAGIAGSTETSGASKWNAGPRQRDRQQQPGGGGVRHGQGQEEEDLQEGEGLRGVQQHRGGERGHGVGGAVLGETLQEEPDKPQSETTQHYPGLQIQLRPGHL